MVKTITFELNEEQYVKYSEWRDNLDKIDYGTTGGGYWFCFCPTGIGQIIEVRRDDGAKIDLTEVDKW